MAKKSFFSGFMLLALVYITNADDLEDLLQDLAIQTACLGMYSKAETGVNVISRYEDPPDWYDPPMMAKRFAAMSGNRTRIETFYGVCFDYAQSAWEDILKYQTLYNEAGMKDQQWYIAATDDDPNTIILYDPVSHEKATTTFNGEYLEETSRHNVYAHDGAVGHAWLWVQHKDGTWYWIDPTWTDNTGWVWWGVVKNGKEITYYPSPIYCVSRDFPRPGIANGETRSPDSTYIANYPDNTRSARFVHYPGSAISGIFIGYISSFDSTSKYGFTFDLNDYVPAENAWVGSIGFDYLVNDTAAAESMLVDSLLIGATIGYQMFSMFVVYAGGGIGLRHGEEWYEFAWKVNGGLRLQFGDFFVKFDVANMSPFGLSFGAGIGLFFL